MGKFSDYCEARMHQPTQKEKERPMVLKPGKDAIGHQPHQSGGGVWSDKRKRRQGNRSQQIKKVIDND